MSSAWRGRRSRFFSACGLNQLLIGRSLVQCVSDVQFMIAKKNAVPDVR